MDPILVYPDPPPPDLIRTLDLAGYPWKAASDPAAARETEPDDGWSAAVVVVGSDPADAITFSRNLRNRDIPVAPLLLLIPGGFLGELATHEALFDDFCLTPFHPSELEARMRHLLAQTGLGARAELVEYGPLVLNLETYQAAIDGRPVDLTYMEYELLKYLAQNPGRVFTRETLLSRVWGYEYYGGARTVDVHIRRLRAKLGEEHAGLISTVRSVGYRFGQSRWGT